MITLCREGEEPPFFAMIRVVLLSVSVTKPSVRVCTEYPSQGCATYEKLFMLPARLGWAGVGGGGTSHTLHPTVRDSASRAARPGPHPAPASHSVMLCTGLATGHWPHSQCSTQLGIIDTFLVLVIPCLLLTAIKMYSNSLSHLDSY